MLCCARIFFGQQERERARQCANILCFIFYLFITFFCKKFNRARGGHLFSSFVFFARVFCFLSAAILGIETDMVNDLTMFGYKFSVRHFVRENFYSTQSIVPRKIIKIFIFGSKSDFCINKFLLASAKYLKQR